MSNDEYGITEFQLSCISHNDSSVIILDLRKKEDFAKGHIKKSILVKFDEKKLVDVPQNSKVILVGYNEVQSKNMANALRANKINSYYLFGGISGYTSGLYCTNVCYIGTGYP